MEKRPRRAPAPGERKADPDRSRRCLLDAALEEFASRGYAGARVADIAVRAGVNKQLISYYFGGKEGLYRALHTEWLAREADLAPDDVPLADLVPRYLRAALADPRPLRLMLWQALADDAEQPPPGEPEDLTGMRRRQSDGELAPGLDPAVVLLILTAAVAAPVVMPREVRRILGTDPASPDFADHYAEQLRRVVTRLAADLPDEPGRKPTPPPTPPAER